MLVDVYCPPLAARGGSFCAACGFADLITRNRSLMPDIADRLKNVTVSASVAMTQKARDLAAQGIDVVGLSTGEPDFPTPPHVIDSAYAAACAGDTR